ncbi:DUF899 family protein [Kutzneria buriramensis]|uniref:Uncharacterized protein DUF899 n=1 Tax=Kutzneria buriramensis TaxID=1045776 RepID=A0A3E0HII1_9PSEU|nr:DUF899 family protein [Kutzneria buriramensis]REH46299.1 uncharacterized protein DUF899 [Kutzneria buriramensis]
MNSTHRAWAVAPVERQAARLRLLAKEQDLTRARDAVAADRMRMPWLKVEQAAHPAHLNAGDTTTARPSHPVSPAPPTQGADHAQYD